MSQHIIISGKQIKQIAERLNDFLRIKPLEERYKIPVPELPYFCQSLNKKIQAESDSYKQNKILKENLKDCFSKTISDQKKLELVNYIVNTWGGISEVKQSRRKNLIFQDIDSSDSVEMNISESDYIASRSKVLSFLKPEEYVICDSRVIFTLNWLLLITRSKDKLIQFSELELRNRICKSYKLSYLLDKFKIKPFDNIIDKYTDYLDIVKILTNELKKTNTDWKLYSTEMLLFQIADDLEYGIPSLIRDFLFSKISSI